MKTQNYSIKVTTDEDGIQAMHRINEGFSNMELLGMMTFISMEIKQQIEDSIKPTKIIREVILNKDNE